MNFRIFAKPIQRLGAVLILGSLVAAPLTAKRKPKPPEVPSQQPIEAGCVRTYDIYAKSGGSYLLQGTILQKDVPHLQATIGNYCSFLVTVFVTIGYFNASGTQFDSKIETAAVAGPGTYAFVHILDCAKYGDACTPEQWTTRMKIIEVKPYHN